MASPFASRRAACQPGEHAPCESEPGRRTVRTSSNRCTALGARFLAGPRDPSTAPPSKASWAKPAPGIGADLQSESCPGQVFWLVGRRCSQPSHLFRLGSGRGCREHRSHIQRRGRAGIAPASLGPKHWNSSPRNLARREAQSSWSPRNRKSIGIPKRARDRIGARNNNRSCQAFRNVFDSRSRAFPRSDARPGINAGNNTLREIPVSGSASPVVHITLCCRSIPGFTPARHPSKLPRSAASRPG